ncbi:MAG TPA: prepilin-type N-terminal cleavage/methylation domain-containing protein [Gemmatimonadaceae bacterium]|nr:prepilin-type N-terminal cleavage/methylation domain-containing protein [Gemmatimonadaceae bacterium]
MQPPRVARRRSRGFTLPEVLLAVLLFAVGFLGLVSSATAIAAQVAGARELARAALLAGTALDSLRASPCAGVTGGVRVQGRATLTWTAAVAPGTVAIRASLTLPGRSGPRRWDLETLLPCER